MKIRKKQAVIGCLIAALLTAPPVIYAAVFRSGARVNRFQEAAVEIEVQENGSSGAQMTRALMLDADSKSAAKQVQIHDMRSREGEAVRVSFVPMWYDSDGLLCGNVFDFRSASLNSGRTALVYADDDKRIILQLAEGWEENGWIFAEEECCFYYIGMQDAAGMTPELLARVSLNDEAFPLTADYTLEIDVLADAVQTSAEAGGDRGWTHYS